MKKKLLFVNESLTLAGGEKSLIALLSNLDPEIYEIDLQLFVYGGELDSFVPAYVNILPPIPYTTFSRKSLLKNISTLYKKGHLRFLLSKLRYSFNLRLGEHSNPEKAQLYWEAIRRSIFNNSKNYDVAIAYAQGIPTYYVNEKINAVKKLAWVNVNVKFPAKNKLFQEKHYQKFDKIIAVSELTHEHLKMLFPLFEDKYETVYDILDYRSIVKLSKEKTQSFPQDSFNILTVARLNKWQKGYDITLEVCKILKDRKVNFHWYAIGTGPYKSEMEEYIKENRLEKHFTFLGSKKNPYPYFKNSDLYVQTSRHEGFGLSIAEARLLNIPVVTTRFDTVFMQMIDGKNGLVVNIDAKAVADGIERIMKDKELYNSIVNYLENEEKENYESVRKFDSLIKELLDSN